MLLSDVEVVDSAGISDHLSVHCVLHLDRFRPKPITYQYRKLREMDLPRFESDLESSTLFTHPSDTADGFTKQLEGVIWYILDVHAPLSTQTKIPGKTVNRHLPPDVVAAKRRRRQLERRWKNTKSESDRVAYMTVCRKTNTLITNSLRDYFAGKINEAQSERASSVVRHPRPSALQTTV